MNSWLGLCLLVLDNVSNFRKGLIWLELDQLLRGDDDAFCASIPYVAVIPEYRAVFISHEDAVLEKSWNLANGYAVHDIQHPCR